MTSECWKLRARFTSLPMMKILLRVILVNTVDGGITAKRIARIESGQDLVVEGIADVSFKSGQRQFAQDLGFRGTRRPPCRTHSWRRCRAATFTEAQTDATPTPPSVDSHLSME